MILLLISPDFLASDYCYSLEMRRVLERHETGKARVIPILLRYVDWPGLPFSSLQALPTDARPITAWRNRDAAFIDVAKGLRRVIENLSIDLSDRKVPDDLEADFQARQQAISRVARADPENIQEVAASQLSIINSYYQSGLQQSQQSFQWSLIWGGIGLTFLIAAVSFLLFHQATEVALASGIGGAIVEVFAATYLYLYKHASDQLAAFRSSLEDTQRLLLVNSMCEKLEGEIEQRTRADLIQSMVNSVVNNPTTYSSPDKGTTKSAASEQ